MEFPIGGSPSWLNWAMFFLEEPLHDVLFLLMGWGSEIGGVLAKIPVVAKEKGRCCPLSIVVHCFILLSAFNFRIVTA